MPTPMTKFRIYKPKVEKHSFKVIRDGSMAYCEYGDIKTYANITQADKKVNELKELGFNVYRRYQYPFLILQSNTL